MVENCNFAHNSLRANSCFSCIFTLNFYLWYFIFVFSFLLCSETIFDSRPTESNGCGWQFGNISMSCWRGTDSGCPLYVYFYRNILVLNSFLEIKIKFSLKLGVSTNIQLNSNDLHFVLFFNFFYERSNHKKFLFHSEKQ